MNPKDKVGRTKPPLHVVPCGPLYEAGGVLLSGAIKYVAHNWRTNPILASVYYDAALRHLMAWWEGEDVDRESGFPHLAHAIAGLMILRDAQMNGTAQDDRPPKCADGWMASVQQRVAALLAKEQTNALGGASK